MRRGWLGSCPCSLPWVLVNKAEEEEEDAAVLRHLRVFQTGQSPLCSAGSWGVVAGPVACLNSWWWLCFPLLQSLSVKSCKVFRIFRQWESMNFS